MRRISLLTALAALCLASPAYGMEATLSGSPASMVRQNQVAKANDYSFLRSATQVERFVQAGYLVPVESNESLRVNGGVSYPVARPEMKLFLERLAEQYLDACGEPLVVTSLVRPTSEQPRNSHPLSVHPAGMAVDLRISSTQSCRSWLESTLLALEAEEVLDVTRERNPPHYHVALFTDRYLEHVRPLLARDSARAAEAAREQAARLAMASLEHVASPLVPAAAPQTAEGEGGSGEGRKNAALFAAVVIVLGSLGTKRIIDRRSTR